MEAMDWRSLGAVKREKAAEILGDISPHTVDDMLSSGQLRSLRAGRRVLVTVHSLRAALGEIAASPALSAPAAPDVPAVPARPALPLTAQRILREARRRVG